MTVLPRILPVAPCLLLCWAAAPARAAIPQPVEAMIREAVRSGDDATVAAVVKVAKASNPAEAEAIGALAGSLQTAQKAAAEQERRARLDAQGLLEGWKGEGQLGAGLASGNTSETSVVIGLTLAREGLYTRQKLTGLVDYLRTNGATARQKFALDYRLDVAIGDKISAVATLGWERDKFAGFTRRFTESLGLGYRPIDRPGMRLELAAGPALRQTLYLGTGEDAGEDGLAGRASLDWRWTIREGMALSENMSVLAAPRDTTLISTTALTARLNGSLSARLSYNIQRESDPPLGLKSTDSRSRATLAYSF